MLLRWIFESLQKPVVLKKTPSGMLHLFYPLRKPSPPDTPYKATPKRSGQQ
jgi:hypothetical protein